MSTVKELTNQIAEMRHLVYELQTRVANIERGEVGKIRTDHPYADEKTNNLRNLAEFSGR